jgi:hypothetical protein
MTQESRQSSRLVPRLIEGHNVDYPVAPYMPWNPAVLVGEMVSRVDDDESDLSGNERIKGMPPHRAGTLLNPETDAMRIVKTALLATIWAIDFASIGHALASTRGGPAANTYVYPNYWGQAETQSGPSATARDRGDSATGDMYVAQPGHGTWLFPPSPYH